MNGDICVRGIEYSVYQKNDDKSFPAVLIAVVKVWSRYIFFFDFVRPKGYLILKSKPTSAKSTFVNTTSGDSCA